MTLRANIVLLLLASALSAVACASETKADDKGDVARGHQIAVDKCSRCHAVEKGKTSPASDAPPFYTFARMWPVENIEESLAEGIMVGHEEYPMPVFVLQPDEIADLVAYLKSIQVPADDRPN